MSVFNPQMVLPLKPFIFSDEQDTKCTPALLQYHGQPGDLPATPEYFIVCDASWEPIIGYRFWQILESARNNGWLKGMAQYGINDIQYAGFAFIPTIVEATPEQIHALLQPYVKKGRVVFCFTSAFISAPGYVQGRDFCAYHFWDESGPYAVIPRPISSSCTAGLPELDAATIMGTHEANEAFTRPFADVGWWADSQQGNNEDADQCNWQGTLLDVNDGTQGMYTKYWSNDDATCYPI